MNENRMIIQLDSGSGPRFENLWVVALMVALLILGLVLQP
jgi:hypothetical protein